MTEKQVITREKVIYAGLCARLFFRGRISISRRPCFCPWNEIREALCTLLHEQEKRDDGVRKASTTNKPLCVDRFKLFPISFLKWRLLLYWNLIQSRKKRNIRLWQRASWRESDDLLYHDCAIYNRFIIIIMIIIYSDRSPIYGGPLYGNHGKGIFPIGNIPRAHQDDGRLPASNW